MIINKDFEIIDLALRYKDNLVISDLHIGIEESLNKKGILIPRFQFKEIMNKLEKIFEKINVKKIIINGDFKHEFGEISEQEWRNCLKIIDYLLDKGDVVIVKGNHDVLLKPIINKRNVKIVDYFIIDDVAFLHGNKIIKNIKAKTLVIGDVHSAITLKKGIRKEKYKCFLIGKWKNKKIIVVPAFSSLSEGIDVSNLDKDNPYLEDIKNFEVYIVEDKVYNFGLLKNINQYI